MDYTKVPIGLSMALMQSEDAMRSYAGMTRAQQQEFIRQAHHARSEAEMHRIVSSIADGSQ